MKQKKIAIIGNYGAKNLGDDIILESILRSLENLHKVTVFTSDEKNTNNLLPNTKTAPLFPCGIRSLFKGTMRRSMKNLKQVDCVILGGGGLFQDDELKAIFIWFWQFFWCYIYKKPVFIWATSVGPLKRRISQWITKWVYARASFITVRDEESKKLLKKIGFDVQKVYTTSDPAFSFFNTRHKKDSRIKKVFTLSLRDIPLKTAHFEKEYIQLIHVLFEKYNGRFQCISMQDNIDKPVFQKIVKKLPSSIQKHVEILSPKTRSELEVLLEKSSFAIGTRLHFIIFCALTNTPCIAIDYSKKVESITQLLQIKSFKPKDFKSQAVFKTIETLKEKPPKYNTILKDLHKKSLETLSLFHSFISSI